jgi:hypothetical protein
MQPLQYQDPKKKSAVGMSAGAEASHSLRSAKGQGQVKSGPQASRLRLALMQETSKRTKSIQPRSCCGELAAASDTSMINWLAHLHSLFQLVSLSVPSSLADRVVVLLFPQRCPILNQLYNQTINSGSPIVSSKKVFCSRRARVS